MVHLPFREKRSDKSELMKLARAEHARHSKEKASGSQGKVMSSEEKLTGSKETLGEQKLVLPQIDTGSGSRVAREPHVNKGGRSSSPPKYSEILRPLSPPEFPQRSISASGSSSSPQTRPVESSKAQQKSPKQQLKSPTTPSISLRGRNPFSDAQPSGDTPKIPQKLDPLFDCMFRMGNVAAEQVPTVVTPEGPRSPPNAGKGEFVTDEGLAKDKTWIQKRIATDDSTEATGILPATATAVKRRTIMAFPTTKGVARQSPSSRRNQRPGDHHRTRSNSPMDYLKVNIPHVTLDMENMWPELHTEVEQMTDMERNCT